MKVSVLSVLLSGIFISITCPNVAVRGKSITEDPGTNEAQFEPSETGTSLQNESDLQCDKEKCQTEVCKCCKGWALVKGGWFSKEHCKKCDCGKDFNCSFSGMNDVKSCICPDGYGDVSGVCVDKCATVKCLNGGKCDFIRGKQVCNCTDRYEGDKCEKDKCAIIKCLNGGKCDFIRSKRVCNCTHRYEGDKCEKDKCASVNCLNGGKCDFIKNKQVCNCTDRYEGAKCEKDKCARVICLNGGKCDFIKSKQVCNCTDRYEGDKCEKENFCKTKCGDRPGVKCIGNAYDKDELKCGCEDANKEYEESSKTCNDLQCDKNGCRTNVCRCCPGWSLVKGFPFDSCSKCDCGNEFNCTFRNGRKICHCPDGYSEIVGVCEAVQDFSTSSSSSSVSSTTQIVKEPKTVSPDVRYRTTLRDLRTTRDRKIFTTTHSTTTATRPCVLNPCKNAGICRMENNNMRCYCASPFRGKYCEKDQCSDQPCQNGGRCYAVGDRYQCICKNTFSGKFCEIDLCGSNPCEKGGFCEVESKVPKWYCYVRHGEEDGDNQINSRIVIIFSSVCSGLTIVLIASILCHCIRHVTTKK